MMNSRIKITWVSILLSLMVVLAGQDLHAQKVGSITGRVLSDSTGMPMENVNVFLNNTFHGAATNSRGFYNINNISPGTYELIVTHIGYIIQTEVVAITPGEELQKDFRLVPNVIRGEEVVFTNRLTGKKPQKLEQFERLFFGETDYASQCSIENPEVLNVVKDNIFGRFIVGAHEPLYITNEALGYRETVYLLDFDWKGDEGIVLTKMQFEEMQPESDREQKKWRTNRSEAYLGSRQHFFRSLINGEQAENGFHISYYKMKRGRLRGKGEDVTESAHYLYISDADTPGVKIFGLDGALEVEFIHDDGRREISYLTTDTSTVYIDTTGYFFRESYVYEGGYWGKQRVADELPSDYMPH